MIGVSVIATGNYVRPPADLPHIRFEGIVGDRDNPIAVEHASELAGPLDEAGKRVGLHALPGVGHGISNEAIRVTQGRYVHVVGTR